MQFLYHVNLLIRRPSNFIPSPEISYGLRTMHFVAASSDPRRACKTFTANHVTPRTGGTLIMGKA